MLLSGLRRVRWFGMANLIVAAVLAGGGGVGDAEPL